MLDPVSVENVEKYLMGVKVQDPNIGYWNTDGFVEDMEVLRRGADNIMRDIVRERVATKAHDMSL